MQSTVLVLDQHSYSHSSYTGPEEALMLMLESKQNRMRLGATPSPLLSPHRPSSAAKDCEAWHEMERINVQEIKDQIVKRVGMKRARSYFSHFRNFVSLQSSKAKLDNLVVKTIGKENVKLHNQLIRAILTNAVKGKVAPQNAFNNKPPGRPYSPCITSDDYASPSTVSNGDSLLPSPRCGRIATLSNRKASPLRPRENHSTPDLLRPQQQHDTPAKLLDAESNCSLKPSMKRARVLHPLPDEWTSGAQSAAFCGEDSRLIKEGMEKLMPPFSFANSIIPPRDVPFFFPNGCRKLLPQAFPMQVLHDTLENRTSMDAAVLPDGNAMHMHMEQVAATQGLEGVSKESANILNNALDAYITRLLRSYMNFKRPPSRDDSVQSATSFDGNANKCSLSGPRLHQHMNGVWSGHGAVEHMQENIEKTKRPISLADFKLAVDTNPQILGEDWPLQLEKILFRMFND